MMLVNILTMFLWAALVYAGGLLLWVAAVEIHLWRWKRRRRKEEECYRRDTVS